MFVKISLFAGVFLAIAAAPMRAAFADEPKDADLPAWPLHVDPPHISTDKSVTYDYPIVYVRAPKTIKRGDREVPTAWPEFGHPTRIDPGYDLMLLKPDGAEEVLVEGGKGAVTDPFVSFDGQSV